MCKFAYILLIETHLLAVFTLRPKLSLRFPDAILSSKKKTKQTKISTNRLIPAWVEATSAWVSSSAHCIFVEVRCAALPAVRCSSRCPSISCRQVRKRRELLSRVSWRDDRDLRKYSLNDDGAKGLLAFLLCCIFGEKKKKVKTEQKVELIPSYGDTK